MPDMHEHLHNLKSWFSYLSPKSKIMMLTVFVIFAVLASLGTGNWVASSKMSLMEELGLGPLTKKQDGDRWVIPLISGQPLAPIKESALKPGLPITVTPDVRVTDKTLSIGLDAKGQAGEKYIPGVAKNGKWQEAPTFEVVDQSGKVLGSGQFEYG